MTDARELAAAAARLVWYGRQRYAGVALGPEDVAQAMEAWMLLWFEEQRRRQERRRLARARSPKGRTHATRGQSSP